MSRIKEDPPREKAFLDKNAREGSQLEFMLAKGGLPGSFFETYSAFCNARGGRIYIGIAELPDHSIVPGMLTEDEVNKLKADLLCLLNDPKKVSANLLREEDVRIKEFEGYPVLEVIVPPAPRELRPVYINGNVMTGSFRRNGEGDFRCSVPEVTAMLRDAGEKGEDLRILEDMGLDAFSEEAIASYKNLFRAVHPDHMFLQKGGNEFLEFLGAIRLGGDGKFHPTVAGLLMFGQAHKIVYEFPEYFLDYQQHYAEGELRWTDRIVSDSGEWSGCLFDFFFQIVHRLTSTLEKPFRMKGIERIDETSLHKAVREGLCNAMANADFHLPKGLVVKQFSDRIEFHNPGGLRMPKEKAFQGEESDPRNKTILKMWSLVGVGERAGSGIPMILSACREFGYEAPELWEDYEPSRTHLVIHLRPKEGKRPDVEEGGERRPKWEQKGKRVLSYLAINGESKAKDVAAGLGLSLSTAKATLYQLLRSGAVSSKGTIKDKRYFLPGNENLESKREQPTK